VCLTGTSPNVTDYSQTLPALECQEWISQCIAAHPNDLAGQTACQSWVCGHKNATAVQSAGSAASSSALSSSSTSKSTSSASGSYPTPFTTQQSSSSTSLNSSSTSTSTLTSTSTSPSTSSSNNPGSNTQRKESSGLSSGAIAGIVVVVVVVVFILGLAFFLFWRRRRKENKSFWFHGSTTHSGVQELDSKVVEGHHGPGIAELSTESTRGLSGLEARTENEAAELGNLSPQELSARTIDDELRGMVVSQQQGNLTMSATHNGLIEPSVEEHNRSENRHTEEVSSNSQQPLGVLVDNVPSRPSQHTQVTVAEASHQSPRTEGIEDLETSKRKPEASTSSDSDVAELQEEMERIRVHRQRSCMSWL
jgi:hypothetical protein